MGTPQKAGKTELGPSLKPPAVPPNPKGIPQQSPGLRGTSYPGIMRPIDDNPERVEAHGNGSATRPQPRWGCETPATFTQGSSRTRNPGLCCGIPLGFFPGVRDNYSFL